MAWDYAELSKAAKEVGGPEKLMDFLVESGKNTGHKEMLPLVGITVGIGALGYAGINKLVKFFKKREKISPEAVEAAKKELVQGIKEYGAKHPDVGDSDMNVQEGDDDNE